MYPKEKEIVEWAAQRGIISAADRYTQALKTLEEVAELTKNYLKGRPVTDDIGDIYVTIAVQANMNGTDLQSCHQNPIDFPERNEVKKQIGDMIQDVGMLLEAIDSDMDVTQWISNIYNGLITICDKLGLSLHFCVAEAYEEISGRKGKMVDGVFVKNE